MSKQAFDGTVEIVTALIGSLGAQQANYYANTPNKLNSTIQAVYDKLDAIEKKSASEYSQRVS